MTFRPLVVMLAALPALAACSGDAQDARGRRALASSRCTPARCRGRSRPHLGASALDVARRVQIRPHLGAPALDLAGLELGSTRSAVQSPARRPSGDGGARQAGPPAAS